MSDKARLSSKLQYCQDNANNSEDVNLSCHVKLLKEGLFGKLMHLHSSKHESWNVSALEDCKRRTDEACKCHNGRITKERQFIS